jgi:hypothetical protein
MTPGEPGAVSARTLLGLGGLAYLLLAARPAVLIGFGAVTVGRALLEGRCGKRGG